jgi:hypothetical protein
MHRRHKKQATAGATTKRVERSTIEERRAQAQPITTPAEAERHTYRPAESVRGQSATTS